MNLKENIKSVSIFANQEQGDIQVDFVVSEELFNKSMIVIEKQLQEIYVPLPVCGGDIDSSEKWGWVQFEDFSLSAFIVSKFDIAKNSELNIVYSENEKIIRLSFPLTPEKTDDYDSEHEHFFSARPSVWIDAAAAFKQLFGE